MQVGVEVSETIRVQTVGTGSAYALQVSNSARLWRYHHDRYCITLTLAGQGRWRYRRRDAEVSPSGLMLMEPGEVHANTSVESPGTFLALFVAPEEIDELLQCTEANRPHFEMLNLGSKEAREELLRLHSVLDAEDAEAQQEHLALSLTKVLSLTTEREIVAPRPSHHKLRLGVKLLEERYRAQPTKTVDVRQVAVELSMNYHWFVHCFRNEFGLAPYQFVKTLRVSKARSMMSVGPNDGTRTLGDIAFQVGYSDSAHMHREFLRDCGIKPSELAAALNPRWQGASRAIRLRSTQIDLGARSGGVCGSSRSTKRLCFEPSR